MPKLKGITNDPAKFLASLQRELGESYTGAGMTRTEASAEIKACLARRDERCNADSDPRGEPPLSAVAAPYSSRRFDVGSGARMREFRQRGRAAGTRSEAREACLRVAISVRRSALARGG